MKRTVAGWILLLAVSLLGWLPLGSAQAQPITEREYRAAEELFGQGRYEEALQAFDQMYQRSQMLELKRPIGHTLLKLGRWREARQAAQELLDGLPTAPSENRHEWEQLSEQAQRGQAAECFEHHDWGCSLREHSELYERTKHPTLLLPIAQARLMLKQDEAAKAAAQQFLDTESATAEQRQEARRIIAEADKSLTARADTAESKVKQSSGPHSQSSSVDIGSHPSDLRLARPRWRW